MKKELKWACSLPSWLGGVEECRKLTQWGQGRSHSHSQFFFLFAVQWNTFQDRKMHEIGNNWSFVYKLLRTWAHWASQKGLSQQQQLPHYHHHHNNNNNDNDNDNIHIISTVSVLLFCHKADKNDKPESCWNIVQLQKERRCMLIFRQSDGLWGF